jgi:hypothetical protein
MSTTAHPSPAAQPPAPAAAIPPAPAAPAKDITSVPALSRAFLEAAADLDPAASGESAVPPVHGQEAAPAATTTATTEPPTTGESAVPPVHGRDADPLADLALPSDSTPAAGTTSTEPPATTEPPTTAASAVPPVHGRDAAPAAAAAADLAPEIAAADYKTLAQVQASAEQWLDRIADVLAGDGDPIKAADGTDIPDEKLKAWRDQLRDTLRRQIPARLGQLSAAAAAERARTAAAEHAAKTFPAYADAKSAERKWADAFLAAPENAALAAHPRGATLALLIRLGQKAYAAQAAAQASSSAGGHAAQAAANPNLPTSTPAAGAAATAAAKPASRTAAKMRAAGITDTNALATYFAEVA